MPIVATVATSECTGHDNCPPTKAVDANQSIMFVNGSPVMVIGGTFEPHECAPPASEGGEEGDDTDTGSTMDTYSLFDETSDSGESSGGGAGHASHIPTISTGSAIVHVNGIPVARVGDIVGTNCETEENTIKTGDATMEIEQ